MTGDAAGKNPYCERQGRCISGCPTGRSSYTEQDTDKPGLSVKPNVSLESLADVSHVSLRTDGRYEVFYKTGAKREREKPHRKDP